MVRRQEVSIATELRLPCGVVLKNRLCKAAMTEGQATVTEG